MHNNKINLKPKSFDKLNLFGINLDKGHNILPLKQMNKVCKVEW